jgi:hypothetical protein
MNVYESILSRYKIEFRKFTSDDLCLTPKCFSNEFPGLETRLIRHDNCGMILLSEERPHYYFHNMNLDSSRWSGFIRLGEGPLSLQSEVAYTETAQSDPITSYDVVSDSPITYGVQTTSGIEMQFTYNENGCVWREGRNGEVLDVVGEWFPYGLICHLGSEYNIPFVHFPVLLRGTYRGAPVEFLACIDRIFSPIGKEDVVMKNATSYISSYCSGIRHDGRKEWFIGLICKNNGKGLGIYWLEGEQTVISDQVINEGIWEKLPYIDDGTVVCIDNIWHFGGREFHVIGHWGAKGFTATPNLGRHGQSQVFGTWYEGETPYTHRIWNTFSENMDAYAESMKKRGFKVKD